MRPDNAIQNRQKKRENRKTEHLNEAAKREDRAAQTEEKAIQRLEGGKGNPVEVVLYERQKQILANQRAIMAELGIEMGGQ